MTNPSAPQIKPAEHWFEKTFIWRTKVWLQFTGWLLYLANFLAILLMLVLTAIGSWIGSAPAFLIWLPAGIAVILTVNLCYDIAMVRYNLRPKEAIPADRADLGSFDLIRSRVSCRSFQSRNLTPAHLSELLEFAQAQSLPEKQFGPSSIRFEYLAAPLTVWPVVGGHEFLVAIAPAQYNRLSIIDIGRSLQKIVIHATRMGISTCWIGPGADQQSTIDHLGERFNPAQDHLICVCAIGYASKFKPLALRGMQKVQRKRLPLTELFTVDSVTSAPLETTKAPFDAFGRCYEVCQWSPSSYNSQTTRCRAIMTNGALDWFEFYSATASKYYAAVALGIWCANWELGCAEINQKGYFKVPPLKKSPDTTKRPPADLYWIVSQSSSPDT